MRERKYVTMMDPFQIKYGKSISGALSVALLISDLIWVTGTLIGLGEWYPHNFWHQTCCWCHPKVTELIFLNWMKVILMHVILYHLLCYFYRSNNKRGPGFILRCFHLDLCCCSHHIHINGRSLLCSLHRHNTANTHFLQYGEFTCMGNHIPP